MYYYNVYQKYIEHFNYCYSYIEFIINIIIPKFIYKFISLFKNNIFMYIFKGYKFKIGDKD